MVRSDKSDKSDKIINQKIMQKKGETELAYFGWIGKKGFSNEVNMLLHWKNESNWVGNNVWVAEKSSVV